MITGKKIKLPNKLLLVPFFIDQDELSTARKECVKKVKILHSEILIFKDFSVLTGFIGYPAILTLFGFIDKIEEKKITFIGTAGGIGNMFDQPELVSVTSVSADDKLSLIFGEEKITMNNNEGLSDLQADGITVDIAQRETAEWVRQVESRGIAFVEMELYPIASFLGRGFEAYMIITDRVLGYGLDPFPDKRKVRDKFSRILKEIMSRNEKKGYTDA